MGHGAVREDPAIERFNRMREEAYLGFRWTRRTVRTTLLGMFIMPGVLLWASAKTDARWAWTAKLKNEPLAKHAHSEPETE
ncbi:hypothetical protein BDN71DRAFT_1589253 [Pleurotus eryngii]|uniref:NADH dehydrogenase [ubiquinone] 1 beta subcomplex subunit 4 n=1 Tax=Pleurotus eryngii TaxID=5323 RepID=A0A9P5ZYH9_PLEER|nr:hypothetical protein BDN71DRAFT_1589253 [Pleurotus eryngii]